MAEGEAVHSIVCRGMPDKCLGLRGMFGHSARRPLARGCKQPLHHACRYRSSEKFRDSTCIMHGAQGGLQGSIVLGCPPWLSSAAATGHNGQIGHQVAFAG
jgi:hypothetical protein